jgi:hypothetical protein
MFVKDEQVGDLVGSTSVRELFHDIVSPIDPMRIRKHQSYLLLKNPVSQEGKQSK